MHTATPSSQTNLAHPCRADVDHHLREEHGIARDAITEETWQERTEFIPLGVNPRWSPMLIRCPAKLTRGSYIAFSRHTTGGLCFQLFRARYSALRTPWETGQLKYFDTGKA